MNQRNLCTACMRNIYNVNEIVDFEGPRSVYKRIKFENYVKERSYWDL